MKIFQGGTGVGIAPAWLLNHDRIAGINNNVTYYVHVYMSYVDYYY